MVYTDEDSTCTGWKSIARQLFSCCFGCLQCNLSVMLALNDSGLHSDHRQQLTHIRPTTATLITMAKITSRESGGSGSCDDIPEIIAS